MATHALSASASYCAQGEGELLLESFQTWQVGQARCIAQMTPGTLVANWPQKPWP
jgi:hypothetical protein